MVEKLQLCGVKGNKLQWYESYPFHPCRANKNMPLKLPSLPYISLDGFEIKQVPSAKFLQGLNWWESNKISKNCGVLFKREKIIKF